MKLLPIDYVRTSGISKFHPEFISKTVKYCISYAAYEKLDVAEFDFPWNINFYPYETNYTAQTNFPLNPIEK